MTALGEQHSEPAWTNNDLRSLCASLKDSIPKSKTHRGYLQGMKDVDWEKVAFPPFSAEACKKKWTEIFEQMRKTRTLTEIIVEAEDAISNPQKYKSYKKISQVCANFPKRPSPANSIFFEENFALYKKKHPGSSQKQIFKALHAKYRKLPEKEKVLYVEKQKLATKKYKREIQKFSKNKQSPEKKRKMVSENASDEGESSEGEDEDLPPKPPSSGYHLFCKEQMVSPQTIPGEKNLMLMGQRWRVLTEEEKNDYNQRCSEIKAQYLAKLDKYLKNFSMTKQKQIMEKLGIKKQINSKPKMPRRSGFTCFMQAKMGQMNKGGVAPQSRQAKISEMWWKLSEQEKERYRRKAGKDRSKCKPKQQKATPERQEDCQKNKRKKYRSHTQRKINVSNQEDSDEDVSEQVDQSHRLSIPASFSPLRPSDSEDVTIVSSSEEDNDSEDEEQEQTWGDDLTFEIF